MTDHEIKLRLVALHECEVLELTDWELEFIESLLIQLEWPNYLEARPGQVRNSLSEKQRAKAIEVIERYEVETSDGGQETVTKLPPGAERYFRKP